MDVVRTAVDRRLMENAIAPRGEIGDPIKIARQQYAGEAATRVTASERVCDLSGNREVGRHSLQRMDERATVLDN